MDRETRATSELGKIYEAVGMPRDTHTMAVLALVAGVGAWMVAPLVGAVVAVVLGHLARHLIAQSRGASSGGALALGGLVLGYSQIVLWLAAVVLFVAVNVIGAMR